MIEDLLVDNQQLLKKNENPLLTLMMKVMKGMLEEETVYPTSDRWMQQLSWSLSRWETQDIKTQPKFNQYDRCLEFPVGSLLGLVSSSHHRAVSSWS